MRPICLPVTRKSGVNHYEKPHTNPEEPEIIQQNGSFKEEISVAVSSLISKFEANSPPSPRKPSLVKSKSFSAKSAKKIVPRANQTQDDALHHKTEAEVEEIHKQGVSNLRRNFEIRNGSHVSAPPPSAEEDPSPLEDVAKRRMEHFKRLAKKWERDLGDILKYFAETGDYEFYNVRVQDLELQINRDLQGMKVRAEDVPHSEEPKTPERKEVEPLSLVAKIANMYEIKSREVEEKPRTPTPKRLPWTSGIKTPKIKQIEVEEEVMEQEASVEEEKQEEVEESLAETSEESEKKEEPSSLVDTEHLKSASLITSYFNSLSNVNSRNNETPLLNTPRANHVTTSDAQQAEENTPGESIEANEIDPNTKEEINSSHEEHKETTSNELTQEQEQSLEDSNVKNESSNPLDTTVEREFEKYYSEDLKPTGSEERLFEDYYRENVLEESIPEETEEEALGAKSAGVQEIHEDDYTESVAEESIPEGPEETIQEENQEANTAGQGISEESAPKIQVKYEEGIEEVKSAAAVEASQDGYGESVVEDSVPEKPAEDTQVEAEALSVAVTSEQGKYEEESEGAQIAYIQSDEADEDTSHVATVEEENGAGDGSQNRVAEESLEPVVDETEEPKQQEQQSSVEEVSKEEETATQYDSEEAQETSELLNKNLYVVPVIRIHDDEGHPSQEEERAASPDEGSRLLKYITQTGDFLAHEKTGGD